MSNYVKATNFAAKDSLPVGDNNKKVKGAEIDNEFNAIASAISTKSDSNSPTFTGTPIAPTASAATDTTQVATTAFVKDVVTSGGYVTTAGIADDAVTTIKIEDGAVTSAKMGTTTNGYGTRTVSTSDPSGGSDGDVWYKYS